MKLERRLHRGVDARLVRLEHDVRGEYASTTLASVAIATFGVGIGFLPGSICATLASLHARHSLPSSAVSVLTVLSNRARYSHHQLGRRQRGFDVSELHSLPVHLHLSVPPTGHFDDAPPARPPRPPHRVSSPEAELV
jgi:hypothetical protein